MSCEAAPAPTSLVLLPSPSIADGNIEQHVALQRVAEANHIVNLTRQHGGDVFKASGKLPRCLLFVFSFAKMIPDFIAVDDV